MRQDSEEYNFTFVRHPYNWWQSWFRYGGPKNGYDDFDKWILDWGPMYLGMYSLIVSRYIGEDPSYETPNKIKFIGKIENWESDLEYALNESGEPFHKEWFDTLIEKCKNNEGPSKFTNKQDYNRGLSQESKNIIYKTEKWMFEKFGYDNKSE